MIKIKPVLVNVVVMYSLMLGMMVLNYLDAMDRGAHLSAVSNFLVWMSGGTLCVICTCHTYKIDEKGVRQLWLFIPKFTPWSAFTEVSIEPLFPDQAAELASLSLSLYPERRNSSIVRNGRCDCD